MREREFYREHEDTYRDSPVLQQTMEYMKQQRYRAANDSRDKYQQAERDHQLLTDLAREHLSGNAED